LAALARGYLALPLPDDAELRGYGSVPRFTDEPRPGVSVVVPFLGDVEEQRATRGWMRRLRLGPGDEAILVDNGRAAAASGGGGGESDPGPDTAVTTIRATGERSSYHARNVGARRAQGEWLLFLDADTRPPPSLLDDYFREPVDQRCGAVAGGVVAARDQRALVACYAASRRYLSQAAHFRDAHRPYGITANLLVRRAAWEGVGGFVEGIRSGGDADFCWRIQDAGWTLAYREPAAVEHRHRERLMPQLRQMARYSAAIAWMDRRLPGSSPRPPVLRRLGRAAGGTGVWLAAGRPRRSLFSAIDGLVVIAEGVGWLMSNDAPSD
ncbi:MAG: hypothetical protein QOK25_1481, partial [Thermoleophilaceae bacterium]|nr:hypothetical protein [Thermoleophilaceae bacterium]